MKNYSVILFLVALLASFVGYADDRESDQAHMCDSGNREAGAHGLTDPALVP